MTAKFIYSLCIFKDTADKSKSDRVRDRSRDILINNPETLPNPGLQKPFITGQGIGKFTVS